MQWSHLNTPPAHINQADDKRLRLASYDRNVPVFTTWYSNFLIAIHDNVESKRRTSPVAYLPKGWNTGCWLCPIDETYEKMVKKLQIRFGNPSRLIWHIMRNLRQITHATDPGDASILRTIPDKFQEIVRNYEDANHQMNQPWQTPSSLFRVSGVSCC